MQQLRSKFLEQAKKYFGVPYARRYHPPGSEMHDAPLFLDCCGLTRRVLRDLKDDFGFSIGPWNQAYQFDTLPNTITEEEMLPGDLVFITGTYFNPKSKGQKHDMVHVEIWLGDGEKTVGARWQKGVVQVFDSYKFVSKSYYNMQYHFKSLDTWLQGICKSFCPEHPWLLSKFTPGAKSIFSLDEEQDDQGASDFEDDDNVEEMKVKNIEAAKSEQEKTALHTSSDVIHDKMSPVNQRPPGNQRPPVNQCVETSTPDHPSAEIPVFHLSSPNYLMTNMSIEGKTDLYQSLQEEQATTNNTPIIKLSLNKVPKLNQDKGKNNTIDCFEYTELISLQPEHKILSNPQPESINHSTSYNKNCTSTSDRSYTPIDDRGFAATNSTDHVPTDGDTNQKADGSANEKDMNLSTNSTSNSKSPSGDSGKSGHRGQQTDKSKKNSLAVQAPSTSVRGHGPYFYIGGGNGVALVEEPLVARGWRRIHDKNSDNYRLRWVELKSQINYTTFKPGDQLVNRIPNGYLLTTKTGLFNSLREYERVLDRVSRPKSPRTIHMSDFFPESFVLDLKADREAFFETFKDGETWICKPNGMNQGKGIYLVRDLNELKEKYADGQTDKPQKCKVRPHANQRLIQRYVPNPLLLDGKKFDVRSYMLISSTTPFIVFFHQGYCRLSCDNYDPDSHDLALHLTNQYQQKKNPSYQEIKEETVWSMDRFNEYVNGLASEKGIGKDWVLNSFTKQMMKIMTHCFNAVKNKLECQYGFFELLGFDFLVDTDFNVYVLEINCNPALHTNCEVLKQTLPPMIEETLDIVIEVSEKRNKSKAVSPIKSVRRFVQLYNGESSRQSTAHSRPKSLSPTRPRPSPISPIRKKSTPRHTDKPLEKSKEKIKSAKPL